MSQVFNYLVGSLSRIYTTLQEVPDPLILYSFVVGFVLNAVLAIQMLYYWNSPASNKSATSKRKRGGQQKRKNTPLAATPVSASSTGASPKPKTPSTRRRG